MFPGQHWSYFFKSLSTHKKFYGRWQLAFHFYGRCGICHLLVRPVADKNIALISPLELKWLIKSIFAYIWTTIQRPYNKGLFKRLVVVVIKIAWRCLKKYRRRNISFKSGRLLAKDFMACARPYFLPTWFASFLLTLNAHILLHIPTIICVSAKIHNQFHKESPTIKKGRMFEKNSKPKSFLKKYRNHRLYL